MKNLQTVFERYEKKYLMNDRQRQVLEKEIRKHMYLGIYGKSLICNIYYDTPDFLLIRRSIDGGIYKEKLRLRCYGVPDDNSQAFIEIKKKFDGVVYKRRIDTTYSLVCSYLNNFGTVCGAGQIGSEINYFLKFYGTVCPQMFISYDRLAYTGNDNDELRLTIDRNITWRTEDLDLRDGVYGNSLLPKEQSLMEIKIADAMPLWLSKSLSELKIFPVSFSKYGMAYKTYINEMTNGVNCYDRKIV